MYECRRRQNARWILAEAASLQSLAEQGSVSAFDSKGPLEPWFGQPRFERRATERKVGRQGCGLGSCGAGAGDLRVTGLGGGCETPSARTLRSHPWDFLPHVVPLS